MFIIMKSLANFKCFYFRRIFLLLPFLGLSVHAFSQTEELWFGLYTDDDGKIQQGRYKIIQEGRALKSIALEPYGKPRMDFVIIENDTVQRFVKVSWPNKPERIGTLIQNNDRYYSGNFEEGTKVLPMTIKAFDFQDAQLQGNWFKPTEIEVQIIGYAKKLLQSESHWNKKDNRICESKESYSLFCALYEASIKVDGEYRHLRPALKFVREVIEQTYPKKYDHVLMDFNNAEEITFEELHKVLDLAQKNLLEAIDK